MNIFRVCKKALISKHAKKPIMSNTDSDSDYDIFEVDKKTTKTTESKKDSSKTVKTVKSDSSKKAKTTETKPVSKSVKTVKMDMGDLTEFTKKLANDGIPEKKSKSTKSAKKVIVEEESDNDDPQTELAGENLHKIISDLADAEKLKNYRITRSGKVWSVNSGTFVKGSPVNGYIHVSINNHKLALHRLVALTFHKKIPGKDVVNHINEDKTDNSAKNLEWVTQKENTVKHSKVTSHARQVKQIDPKTKKVVKIFDQITEGANAVGVTRRAIQLVLTGKNNTAGGYCWEYVNADNYADNLNKNDLADSKKVYDYENYYVFSDGRIYNSTTKRFLSPVLNAAGRTYVTLCKNGKKANCYINRIVADHYLANKPGKASDVRHISRDKTDNSVSNLRWTGHEQKTTIVREVLANKKKSDSENEDSSTESDDSDEPKSKSKSKSKAKASSKSKTKVKSESDDDDSSIELDDNSSTESDDTDKPKLKTEVKAKSTQKKAKESDKKVTVKAKPNKKTDKKADKK